MTNFPIQSVSKPESIPLLRAFLTGRLGTHTYRALLATLAGAVQRGEAVEEGAVPREAWPYLPLLVQILQLEALRRPVARYG